MHNIENSNGVFNQANKKFSQHNTPSLLCPKYVKCQRINKQPKCHVVGLPFVARGGRYDQSHVGFIRRILCFPTRTQPWCRQLMTQHFQALHVKDEKVSLADHHERWHAHEHTTLTIHQITKTEGPWSCFDDHLLLSQTTRRLLFPKMEGETPPKQALSSANGTWKSPSLDEAVQKGERNPRDFEPFFFFFLQKRLAWKTEDFWNQTKRRGMQNRLHAPRARSRMSQEHVQNPDPGRRKGEGERKKTASIFRQ